MGTGQNKRKRKIDREGERDRGEDGCQGCGERRAYRNRKMRHTSIVLIVAQGGNVTLDGGEAA